MNLPNIEKQDQYFVLKGPVDFDSVPKFCKQGFKIIKKQGPDIVFDFKSIGKINSAGLALMLSLRKKAKKAKKTVSFVNTPRLVKSIANLYAVSSFLDLK